MKVYVENDPEFKNQDPGNEGIVYMKLILVGPKTLEARKGDLSFLGQVPGTYLLGEMVNAREELHKLVDQACDAFDQIRK